MIAALRWLKRGKETVLQYRADEQVWRDVPTEVESQDKVTITLAGDAEDTLHLTKMLGDFIQVLREEAKARGAKIGADVNHDFKQVAKRAADDDEEM